MLQLKFYKKILLIFILQQSFFALKAYSISEKMCALAKLEVEKTICNNSSLNRLDSQLNDIYNRVLQKKIDRNILKNQQISWLQGRNTCGKTIVCIEEAYKQRLDQLKVLEGIDEKPTLNCKNLAFKVTGLLKWGSLDSAIEGNESLNEHSLSFMTKDTIGKKIFKVCNLVDLCEVTGIACALDNFDFYRPETVTSIKVIKKSDWSQKNKP